MKEDIRISVIIPVYHVEDYIEKCIQSVCGQTYKNLEIILVDDHSKDRSGDICDDYAKRDSRIKVIHQPANGGPALARNTGMAQAIGEYYLFIDGDDRIDETLCERAIGALRGNGKDADTVHWGYCCVDEEGKMLTEEDPVLYPKEKILQPEIFDQFINAFTVSLDDLQNWLSGSESYYEAIHKKKQMATVWRYLFSAKVIRENHISFPQQVDRGEDIVFLLYYLQKSRGIVNLPGKYYYYLQRSDSLMKKGSTVQKQINLIEAMEETVRFTPKEKQEELRRKWQGQRILVVMNTARRQAADNPFWKGYREFCKSAGHPINKAAVKKLSLRGITIKYKVAIGMIKYHLYFLFYFCIYGMKKFHIDMAPME